MGASVVEHFLELLGANFLSVDFEFCGFLAIVGVILAIVTGFRKEFRETPFAEYVLEVDADWLAKKLTVVQNLIIAASFMIWVVSENLH